MDRPGPEGDPLAQPTRARLFAALRSMARPAGTEELAAALGLHVNGVRRHLRQLEEAGLVRRTKSSARRGRPRDQWAVASGASPGGERPLAYADLARWLARAIPSGRARLREVERTGREIGRELATPPEGEPMERFEQALSALGFQPLLEAGADGTVRCRLRNCPYRDPVRENADVVCTLHRGLTAGLLDVLAPEARLASFEPRDPEVAGCVAVVTGAPPAGGRAASRRGRGPRDRAAP